MKNSLATCTQALIIAFLAALALAGASCQPPGATGAFADKQTEQRKMNELEKSSGLDLPADARLIYEEDEDRDGEKIVRRIIKSDSAIDLPKDKERLRIPADSVVRILQRLVPREAPRGTSESEATVCEWSNENGGWRASTIATNENHFLDLEQFILNGK